MKQALKAGKQINSTTRHSSGFTLIELLMILLVVGVFGALLLINSKQVNQYTLHVKADQLQRDLAYARVLALTQQKSVTISFDPTQNSYQLVACETSKLFVDHLPSSRLTCAVKLTNLQLTLTGIPENTLTFSRQGELLLGQGQTPALPNSVAMVTLSDSSGSAHSISIMPQRGLAILN